MFQETNAVHINVGAGSYLEVTIPWITLQDGYTTKINGQLLHLDATTSLQFRDFVSSETLEFCISCHYPLIWNDHQLWEISLTGCKATVNLIFNHKWFFQDLIDDWSSKQRPDLMNLVPYTYRQVDILIIFILFHRENAFNLKKKIEKWYQNLTSRV